MSSALQSPPSPLIVAFLFYCMASMVSSNSLKGLENIHESIKSSLHSISLPMHNHGLQSRSLGSESNPAEICKNEGKFFCNDKLDLSAAGVAGERDCEEVISFLSSMQHLKPVWVGECCVESCATCTGHTQESAESFTCERSGCSPPLKPFADDWCKTQTPGLDAFNLDHWFELYGECQTCLLRGPVTIERDKSLQLRRKLTTSGPAILSANKTFSHFVVLGRLNLAHITLRNGMAHVLVAFPRNWKFDVIGYVDIPRQKRSGSECSPNNGNGHDDNLCYGLASYMAYQYTEDRKTLAYGGAIHISRISKNVTLDSVVIEDCHATGHGGAIFVDGGKYGNNATHLIVQGDSRISGCSATFGGGIATAGAARLLFRGGGSINITSNKAKYDIGRGTNIGVGGDGGGIHFGSAHRGKSNRHKLYQYAAPWNGVAENQPIMIVSDEKTRLYLAENKALFAAGIMYWGRLFVRNGAVLLVERNVAEAMAGGVKMRTEGSYYYPNPELGVRMIVRGVGSKLILKGNSAVLAGGLWMMDHLLNGAKMKVEEGGSLEVVDNWLVDPDPLLLGAIGKHNMPSTGAGLFLSGGETKITGAGTKLVLRGNRGSEQSSGSGAMIFSRGSMLVMDGAKLLVQGNKAGTGGGMFVMGSDARLVVSGAGTALIMEDNIAVAQMGGAMKVNDGAAVRIGLGATAELYNNTAVYGGGIGLDLESSFVMSSDTSINQYSQKTAASFIAMNNTALGSLGGGAVALASGASFRLLVPSIFSGNIAANGNGGAINQIYDPLNSLSGAGECVNVTLETRVFESPAFSDLDGKLFTSPPSSLKTNPKLLGHDKADRTYEDGCKNEDGCYIMGGLMMFTDDAENPTCECLRVRSDI